MKRLLSDVMVNTLKNFGKDKAKQIVACNPDGHVIGDAILFGHADDKVSVVDRPSVPNWVHYNAEAGNYDVKVTRDERTVSNDGSRELVEWYGIPYHHVPVPKEDAAKQAAFQKTADLIEAAEPDTIVLARYMQIFPPWLCEKFRHRVINIHHSFLPSFIGAKPYHQADQRGVKLIGATCHYVTEDLDAGPIIEQDVARIRHSDSIEDMMRLGKDVENTVLARGLRYHLDDRVLVHGNKTILFQ